MMRAFALLVLVALAGCSAAKPAAEAPLADEGPDGVRTERRLAVPENETRGPERLVFSGCDGPSVALYFDAATARAQVPEPFIPSITTANPGGDVGALGHLEQRVCDVVLDNSSLGEVALWLALADVRAPGEMSAHQLTRYLLSLHVDHPQVAAYLAAQGIPAKEGKLDDASTWLVGWSGAFDLSMGGDRIVGAMADTPVAHAGINSFDVFHREGDTVTRWSHEASGSGGDVSEVFLFLDDATWGQPVSPNLYASAFLVGETWAEQEFSAFTPDGEPI